ncbi:MAG: hypothetical protein QGH59_02025, partial [Gemmatimonadota bacterium]|nr:hypothetical protein [Gemmatimonadota bacterium]
MEITITREVGHAQVAAVRLLVWLRKRPPTLEEVAEALESKVEITGHRLRALEARGILRMVETPFETHVHLADHLALEELPEEDTGPGLADEVEAFQKRQEEKSEEFMRIFEEDEEGAERKERHSELEEGLR